MLGELLLLSGNDIPFPEAQLSIHQPTLKEIAYIGEEKFFLGCELLNFTKKSLMSKDRVNLENQTDFDIIIATITENTLESKKSQMNVLLVFTLLFPNYSFEIDKINYQIILINGDEIKVINKKNYPYLQEIIACIFCLQKNKEEAYNPSGLLSQKIADKLKEGQKKRAEMGKTDAPQKISILSRYASILAVGEQKDINILMNYTVFQLFDEWERYNLKLKYDMYIKARLAGAKDLKEEENWMKDLYS